MHQNDRNYLHGFGQAARLAASCRSWDEYTDTAEQLLQNAVETPAHEQRSSVCIGFRRGVLAAGGH